MTPCETRVPLDRWLRRAMIAPLLGTLVLVAIRDPYGVAAELLPKLAVFLVIASAALPPRRE